MTSLKECILENGILDKGDRSEVDEKRLVLPYEELTEIPQGIVEKYASKTEVLDLSHNSIRQLQFLIHFTKLTTLILDHNEITSESRFPGLPHLTTLWINSNKILDLGLFVPRLSRSAPNLRYLSIMKNPATPSSFGSGSYAQYAMYRYYVISYFSKLEHLDEQVVTTEEREESAKHFRYLRLVQFILPITPKFPLVRENKIV